MPLLYQSVDFQHFSHVIPASIKCVFYKHGFSTFHAFVKLSVQLKSQELIDTARKPET